MEIAAAGVPGLTCHARNRFLKRPTPSELFARRGKTAGAGAWPCYTWTINLSSDSAEPPSGRSIRGARRMTVWALFLCIASLHQCQMMEAGRESPSFGYFPGITYPTREACERKAAIYNQHRAEGMLTRCVSKHVETWH